MYNNGRIYCAYCTPQDMRAFSNEQLRDSGDYDTYIV